MNRNLESSFCLGGDLKIRPCGLMVKHAKHKCAPLVRRWLIEWQHAGMKDQQDKGLLPASPIRLT